MDEGTFVGWLKQDRDRVNPGDPVFAVEGDKATEEVAALDAGVLRISADGPRPGDVVKVGQVLAYIVAAGEAPPAAVGGAGRSMAAESGATSAVPAAREGTHLSARRGRAISPRARRAARELGIDWNSLQGSGRNGRIRERDVRAAAGDVGRLIPLTPIRRITAARMVAGVTLAAPVTLTTKADATNLVRHRAQLKASDPAPGYTDLIVKLAAVALRQHPLLQAQWRDDGLFVPDRIDIGVSVDTDAGLLIPVVRGVDRLTLSEIASQWRELIGRARSGRLRADEMRGATFTVTNLGAFGVDAFTPIIPLPQCAVLGVGRIARQPAVVGERIVARHLMTLSLTFDHRVLDGAPAARFLATLRGCLEYPAAWLTS
jgi:pyruvate dehydrogenase E2 component (dihydrolipoamide acetyltransferase)